MKVALIITTINVPRVLALYRKLGPDVAMFVAADEKTPLEAYSFCANIPNCEIYSPDRQRELGYECSALIGWNCIQRRNIALLEAVKWNADFIVSIDDDNIATDLTYFGEFNFAFAGVNGLKASSSFGWFDPGCLLVPQTKHRGFPISIKSDPVFEPVTDAHIGVAAGLCLGDPDIDACTRIATAPIIYSVSELGRAGVVVDPHDANTVFNSQNTAFIRELAPAMFMLPGVGRYDDIYASLICQCIMRENNLHVHFGQPFIWQERNQHNLISDLRAEINGMEKVEHMANFLNACIMPSNNQIENLRGIYKTLVQAELIPQQASEAALAFLDDVEKVL
ncbi:MAG: DUF288 domain-containing protein [Patescibacteria group bacterium]|nr:DUF288 domain-containing protein [Patescibacteria group bacterium]